MEFDSKKYSDTLIDRVYLLTKDDVAIARFTAAADAATVRDLLNGGPPVEPPSDQENRTTQIDAEKLLDFTKVTSLYGVSSSVGGFAPTEIDGFIYAVCFDVNAANSIANGQNLHPDT